ncbi:leucyl-tRNA synthetase [Edwardsiella piscicida]|nr:leucyl-tRNA synthetase [Edwardsiella piscicida]
MIPPIPILQRYAQRAPHVTESILQNVTRWVSLPANTLSVFMVKLNPAVTVT